MDFALKVLDFIEKVLQLEVVLIYALFGLQTSYVGYCHMVN